MNITTLTTHCTQIHTIRPGDYNFQIYDKFTSTARAGFEINKSCPTEYRKILITAIDAGWIKPVARVTERELIFMGLTK
jgi:hypothetical protein